MRRAPTSCSPRSLGPKRRPSKPASSATAPNAPLWKRARAGSSWAVACTGRGCAEEAARLYRAFDAFVLSSRTEGTPIALFEAMAAEVPIVATRVGGVPDVVGETEAWLVDPEDSQAIARALAAIRADPAEARRRCEAARRRLEEDFSLEPWIERYEDLYRSLVAPSRPGDPD